MRKNGDVKMLCQRLAKVWRSMVRPSTLPFENPWLLAPLFIKVRTYVEATRPAPGEG